MNNHLHLILGLGCVLLLGACAAPPLQTGPAGEVSEEGLQRMTGTAFDEVWLRPGVSIGNYRGIVLEPTSVAYREVGEGIRYDSPRMRVNEDAFPIPEAQRARIETTFEQKLTHALEESGRFQIVDEAGPGTLSVRAQLVDFVSKVPREGALGRTEVYVTSVGEATLIIEIWDNERDELVARAVDHQRAGPPGAQLIRGNQVTSWAEMNRQMERCADQARELMDELHQVDSARTAGL